jgi:hypothetical protein
MPMMENYHCRLTFAHSRVAVYAEAVSDSKASGAPLPFESPAPR